ncbi:hypothetical protein DFJ74DRAFT_365365 [Hyaloraphidium curvatum]|nr:hypothetical protein DFJ74DRAFT_365365 [Hyaloraphidium curvatum]
MKACLAACRSSGTTSFGTRSRATAGRHWSSWFASLRCCSSRSDAVFETKSQPHDGTATPCKRVLRTRTLARRKSPASCAASRTCSLMPHVKMQATARTARCPGPRRCGWSRPPSLAPPPSCTSRSGPPLTGAIDLFSLEMQLPRPPEPSDRRVACARGAGSKGGNLLHQLAANRGFKRDVLAVKSQLPSCKTPPYGWPPRRNTLLTHGWPLPGGPSHLGWAAHTGGGPPRQQKRSGSDSEKVRQACTARRNCGAHCDPVVRQTRS